MTTLPHGSAPPPPPPAAASETLQTTSTPSETTTTTTTTDTDTSTIQTPSSSSSTSSSTSPTPSSSHKAASEEEAGLFPSSLVSPTIAAQLPDTYTLRALRKSDFARGFLDCLRVLTVVGDITEAQWDERYEWMVSQGKGGYYLLVIDDGNRVVGTGALIVERKLYVFLSFFSPLLFLSSFVSGW